MGTFNDYFYVRIDTPTKTDSNLLAKSYKITLSEAIRQYLRVANRTGRLVLDEPGVVVSNVEFFDRHGKRISDEEMDRFFVIQAVDPS